MGCSDQPCRVPPVPLYEGCTVPHPQFHLSKSKSEVGHSQFNDLPPSTNHQSEVVIQLLCRL